MNSPFGDGGIDHTFQALFSMREETRDKDTLLSGTIFTLGIQFAFTSSPGDVGQVTNNVLRLYYRARCIFSHGLPSRTLSEGVMKHFPNEEQLKEEVDFAPAAADLANQLKTRERKASSTYLDLCMLCQFFFCLANRLMIAVAIQIHSMLPKQPLLWNYQNYFLRDMVVNPVFTDEI